MGALPLAHEFSIYWFLSGFLLMASHMVMPFFLPKRTHFWLRCVIGISACAAAAYLTCFSDQWNERYYLLLHLAGSLYLAFASRCSLKMIIYFNIWCIALYYFIFQIQCLVNALIHANGNAPLMHLTQAIFGIALILLTIVVLRMLQSKDVYSLPANQVLIAALVSGAIIAFNSITFAYSPEEGYTKFVFQIFSMLCSLLVMYLQLIAYYSQKKNYETEYIKHMWRTSKRDQEMKAEYIDLLNHKYHDLKHEIRALRQISPPERTEYIDQLESSVDQFSSLFQTDNDLLDAILNETRRRCEKEKIMFSCVANCKNTDFMNMVDLSILLGNMLDNAVEAAAKLPEESRILDLKLLSDEHFFRITEKNTFAGELHITSDGIASTKPENGYHGFGSQSMKYIVEQYHGQMALDVEDGIFSLHIVIPVAQTAG